MERSQHRTAEHGLIRASKRAVRRRSPGLAAAMVETWSSPLPSIPPCRTLRNEHRTIHAPVGAESNPT